ncbi:5-oxoprolinase subunit PxpB [Bacillus carboniphilus]|uniref:5-oxoprolinase subunit PxpB n=1 Tax=Bacillus carboniphilus TaxID=86663 RepID=A0ABY9JSR0_9BACI|nr:5-oxoprolinase subunit PxpB [Bacillus carboniphilus]WLR42439.1 5-oxoprolinase subunit PxpB [Bacillus carboniphilus]
MNYTIYPLGDNAITIQLGKHINEETFNKVQTVFQQLNNQSFEWLVELVPSYTAVTLYYDLLKLFRQVVSPFQWVCQTIQPLLNDLQVEKKTDIRINEIPVCYEEPFSPDLQHLTQYHQLTKDEIISIHSETTYLVYMIGFSPGFPYIGGMSRRIATPRKATPQKRIEAGSVGIAGEQTGIYSLDTPGGWNIIGKTPLKMFQPHLDKPSFLKAGDHIQFIPIDIATFKRLEEKQR